MRYWRCMKPACNRIVARLEATAMGVFLSGIGGLKRRVCNCAQRGVVAVEVALILPAFLLLLMGSIEVCLIFGAQALMESAAYSVSRLGKTGFSEAGMTQAETINQKMNDRLQVFGSLIDTSHLITTQTVYDSFSSIGAGGVSGYGSDKQIVVYTISYPWKIVTPINGIIQYMGGTRLGNNNGEINLNARIVVRNEPY